jgi:hypothetical protein
MKNRIAFQGINSGTFYSPFYCILLYLTIDFVITYSLSMNLIKQFIVISLYFYCISAVFPLLIHCYFLSIFSPKKGVLFRPFFLLRIHINFDTHFRIIFSFFQKYIYGIHNQFFCFKRVFIPLNL